MHDIGVTNKNPTAIIALLNSNARDRGWRYTVYNDVNISGHLQHEVHLTGTRLQHVEQSDLARMIEEKRALLDAEPEPRGAMSELNPRRSALHLPRPDDSDGSTGQG